MENISDDERPEVDLILEQRKRKGLLEYLVRWKGSDDDFKRETWEPVKNLTDYAKAIQNFTKRLKANKAKRSSSRSRKSSRSRSRSSSRSRKSTPGKEDVRSRSRGQQQTVETEKVQQKTVEIENVQQKTVEIEKVEVSGGEHSRSTRNSTTKGKTVITEINTASVVNGGAELSQAEPKSESEENTSSNMRTRQQLEVQRVHNEHRPVREDDLKPRSAIWKVADYSVIVLFILSLIAALFLFLEKFVNLEEFKKQAFPNMGVLQARLESVQQSLFDAWLYLIEQVKGAETVEVKPSGA